MARFERKSVLGRKLLILAMAFIVLGVSSSLTYEQSSVVPVLKKWLAGKPFEDWLSLLQIPYWGRIVSVESEGYFSFVEFLIRKGTHFVGFGLIGGIVYWLLPVGLRYRGILAILSIFVVAIADEFRQSFTPGRYMTFQDVLLDTLGAAFAVGMIKLVKRIV